jgi:quercetin dioxygenase-like cupin family protein
MSITHESGSGGSMTILERGSATTPMRFRMVAGKGVAPPAPECHPSQSEDFNVISGTLDLGMVDGKHVVLKAGDTFHIPAGVPHLPNADEGCVFEATLTPGLETADMFAGIYKATREHVGFGRFVRIAIVMRQYRTNICFSPQVNAVMAVVATVARALGVKMSVGVASTVEASLARAKYE